MNTFFYPIYLLFTMCLGADADVIKSESQKWYAGQARSGHGTKYTVTLVVDCPSSKIIFDRFWVGEKYLKPYVYNKSADKDALDKAYFEKGDTLVISANDRIIPEEFRKIDNDEIKIIPPKYKGEALIGYSNLKGKRKVIEIKGFTVLKKVNYP